LAGLVSDVYFCHAQHSGNISMNALVDARNSEMVTPSAL
jgi:hypothetical protein